MTKIKISVPQPCTQQWEHMQPVDKGRFCSFCEKEVIDFRLWSTTELVAWFAKAEQQTCGRFDPSQLEVIKEDSIAPSTRIFSTKILLASCLTLFTTLKAYSGTLPKSDTTIYENKNQKGIKLPLAQTDTLKLNGKVVDSTGLGLLGVKVSIKDSKQAVFTDGLGRFKFQVTKQDRELVLEFTYFGYLTKEITVVPEKLQDLKVELVADGIIRQPVIAGGAVVVVFRKPSLWKRMVKFIKSPF